jgi:hypothetical protein
VQASWGSTDAARYMRSGSDAAFPSRSKTGGEAQRRLRRHITLASGALVGPRSRIRRSSGSKLRN